MSILKAAIILTITVNLVFPNMTLAAGLVTNGPLVQNRPLFQTKLKRPKASRIVSVGSQIEKQQHGEIRLKVANPEDRIAGQIFELTSDAYVSERGFQDFQLSTATLVGSVVVRLCLMKQFHLAGQEIFYESLLLPDMIQNSARLLDQTGLNSIGYLFMISVFNIHLQLLPAIHKQSFSQGDLDRVINTYSTLLVGLLAASVVNYTIWTWDPVALSAQILGIVGALGGIQVIRNLPKMANKHVKNRMQRITEKVDSMVEKELKTIKESKMMQSRERTEIKKYLNMETLSVAELKLFAAALDDLGEKIWNEHSEDFMTTMLKIRD